MIRFWIREKNRNWMQTTGVVVAASFLFSIAVPPFAQASFWEERKSAVENLKKSVSERESPYTQLASLASPLPLGFAPQSLPPLQFSSAWADKALQRLGTHSTAKKEFQSLPTQLIEKLEKYSTIERVQLTSKNDLKMVEGTLASNGPLVIQIQDAHDIYGVQRNIAALVTDLMEMGINIVGVEGSQGPMRGIEKWRKYPDRESLMGVAGYLLKEGLLTGVEVAGLGRTRENVEFYGVEEKEPYLEQGERFKDALKIGEKVGEWYSQVQKNCERKKEKLYSAKAKELDLKKNKYEKGKIKLGEWVEFLIETAPSFGDRSQRALSRYVEAYQLEKSLDFKRVELEQKEVVRRLTEKLNKNDMRELLEESLLYRLGKISFGSFYSELKERCRKANVPISSQMGQYIEYVIRVEGIDKDALFKEVSKVEEAAWDKVLKGNQSAKDIYEMSKDILLIGKAIDFKLNVEDWEQYISRNKEMEKIGERVGVKEPSEVEQVLFDVRRFNELSQERNIIFANRLTHRMAEKNAKVSVLIAGGYHSGGIEENLKAKNVSYITLRPRMDLTEIKEEYHPLYSFKRALLPLEKMFLPEKVTYASQGALGGVGDGFTSAKAVAVGETLENVSLAASAFHGRDSPQLKDLKNENGVLSALSNGYRIQISNSKEALDSKVTYESNVVHGTLDYSVYSSSKRKAEFIAISRAKNFVSSRFNRLIKGIEKFAVLSARWAPKLVFLSLVIIAVSSLTGCPSPSNLVHYLSTRDAIEAFPYAGGIPATDVSINPDQIRQMNQNSSVIYDKSSNSFSINWEARDEGDIGFLIDFGKEGVNFEGKKLVLSLEVKEGFTPNLLVDIVDSPTKNRVSNIPAVGGLAQKGWFGKSATIEVKPSYFGGILASLDIKKISEISFKFPSKDVPLLGQRNGKLILHIKVIGEETKKEDEGRPNYIQLLRDGTLPSVDIIKDIDQFGGIGSIPVEDTVDALLTKKTFYLKGGTENGISIKLKEPLNVSELIKLEASASLDPDLHMEFWNNEIPGKPRIVGSVLREDTKLKGFTLGTPYIPLINIAELSKSGRVDEVKVFGANAEAFKAGVYLSVTAHFPPTFTLVGATPAPSVSPTPAATVSATPTPAPSPTATPSIEPTPTPAPTSTPSSSSAVFSPFIQVAKASSILLLSLGLQGAKGEISNGNLLLVGVIFMSIITLSFVVPALRKKAQGEKINFLKFLSGWVRVAIIATLTVFAAAGCPRPPLGINPVTPNTPSISDPALNGSIAVSDYTGEDQLTNLNLTNFQVRPLNENSSIIYDEKAGGFEINWGAQSGVSLGEEVGLRIDLGENGADLEGNVAVGIEVKKGAVPSMLLCVIDTPERKAVRNVPVGVAGQSALEVGKMKLATTDMNRYKDKLNLKKVREFLYKFRVTDSSLSKGKIILKTKVKIEGASSTPPTTSPATSNPSAATPAPYSPSYVTSNNMGNGTLSPENILKSIDWLGNGARPAVIDGELRAGLPTKKYHFVGGTYAYLSIKFLKPLDIPSFMEFKVDGPSNPDLLVEYYSGEDRVGPSIEKLVYTIGNYYAPVFDLAGLDKLAPRVGTRGITEVRIGFSNSEALRAGIDLTILSKFPTTPTPVVSPTPSATPSETPSPTPTAPDFVSVLEDGNSTPSAVTAIEPVSSNGLVDITDGPTRAGRIAKNVKMYAGADNPNTSGGRYKAFTMRLSNATGNSGTFRINIENVRRASRIILELKRNKSIVATSRELQVAQSGFKGLPISLSDVPSFDEITGRVQDLGQIGEPNELNVDMEFPVVIPTLAPTSAPTVAPTPSPTPTPPFTPIITVGSADSNSPVTIVASPSVEKMKGGPILVDVESIASGSLNILKLTPTLVSAPDSNGAWFALDLTWPAGTFSRANLNSDLVTFALAMEGEGPIKLEVYNADKTNPQLNPSFVIPAFQAGNITFYPITIHLDRLPSSVDRNKIQTFRFVNSNLQDINGRKSFYLNGLGYFVVLNMMGLEREFPSLNALSGGGVFSSNSSLPSSSKRKSSGDVNSIFGLLIGSLFAGKNRPREISFTEKEYKETVQSVINQLDKILKSGETRAFALHPRYLEVIRAIQTSIEPTQEETTFRKVNELYSQALSKVWLDHEDSMLSAALTRGNGLEYRTVLETFVQSLRNAPIQKTTTGQNIIPSVILGLLAIPFLNGAAATPSASISLIEKVQLTIGIVGMIFILNLILIVGYGIYFGAQYFSQSPEFRRSHSRRRGRGRGGIFPFMSVAAIVAISNNACAVIGLPKIFPTVSATSSISGIVNPSPVSSAASATVSPSGSASTEPGGFVVPNIKTIIATPETPVITIPTPEPTQSIVATPSVMQFKSSANSPDGKIEASLSNDTSFNYLNLKDVDSGLVKTVIMSSGAGYFTNYHVEFSPDGQTIAVLASHIYTSGSIQYNPVYLHALHLYNKKGDLLFSYDLDKNQRQIFSIDKMEWHAYSLDLTYKPAIEFQATVDVMRGGPLVTNYKAGESSTARIDIPIGMNAGKTIQLTLKEAANRETHGGYYYDLIVQKISNGASEVLGSQRLGYWINDIKQIQFSPDGEHFGMIYREYSGDPVFKVFDHKSNVVYAYARQDNQDTLTGFNLTDNGGTVTYNRIMHGDPRHTSMPYEYTVEQKEEFTLNGQKISTTLGAAKKFVSALLLGGSAFVATTLAANLSLVSAAATVAAAPVAAVNPFLAPLIATAGMALIYYVAVLLPTFDTQTFLKSWESKSASRTLNYMSASEAMQTFENDILKYVALHSSAENSKPSVTLVEAQVMRLALSLAQNPTHSQVKEVQRQMENLMTGEISIAPTIVPNYLDLYLGTSKGVGSTITLTESQDKPKFKLLPLMGKRFEEIFIRTVALSLQLAQPIQKISEISKDLVLNAKPTKTFIAESVFEPENQNGLMVIQAIANELRGSLLEEPIAVVARNRSSLKLGEQITQLLIQEGISQEEISKRVRFYAAKGKRIPVKNIYLQMVQDGLARYGLDIITDKEDRLALTNDGHLRIKVYQLLSSTLVKEILNIEDITHTLRSEGILRIQA